MSVCFYAHKGGVGKSTITYELAVTATSLGTNIVIIDADSQLNTTFTMLKRLLPMLEINDLIEHLLAQNVNSPTITLQGHSVKTLYTYLNDPNQGFNFNDFIRLGPGINVWFLLGTPLLHKLEEPLNYSIRGLDALVNQKFLFRRLLNNINRHFNNDVLVFVDLSPGSTILNQNILFSCDYLVTPNTPDHNSLLSIKLLYRYMREWSLAHSYLNSNLKLLVPVFNRYKRIDHGMSPIDTGFLADFQLATLAFINEPLNTQFLTGTTHIIKPVEDGMRFTKLASDLHITVAELTPHLCNLNKIKWDAEKVQRLRNDYLALLEVIKQAFDL